ncbi:hypothetical protein DSM104299_00149 [Baekduia alba]|uniref:hypothetical protein n=1 Tax=Baekduia alba TaxID=2997333 RepID=UPI0023413BE9|nr:hypothetical protein [Baekduia alba]WCB91478.1 hypothetical protein DSM104299_00149 [Baekduia alba]
MTTFELPRVHYGFEGRVATLLSTAIDVESKAHDDIASANVDWKFWGTVYRDARGVDGAGCRRALDKIDGCRSRIAAAEAMLRYASDLVGKAVEVEEDGRREWGLE